ncbi:MAG: hypothetical protein QOJ29_5224 [Thermoleophilaceae bacterium]|jgi:uncharacterized protein (DUF1697 family)|nr:hypothetical protein [Thermoleophilaceae bacterium]
MPRYAAFLRGINVGGTRITKDKLSAPFSQLGLEDVTTFRASGNVIFEGPRESATKLAKRIEDRLAADLGFTKAVTFIRTRAEMRALAELNPIPASDDQKVHVMLLLKAPPKQVLELATDADKLALGPRELFWRPEGNMSESELDLKAIENLIGPTTTRTKGTIDQIAERWFS